MLFEIERTTSFDVPVLRAVGEFDLTTAPVLTEAAADEIVLALTEACANVVQHSGDDGDYEVAVRIDDDACRISVWDEGAGFELPDLSQPVDPTSDGGAGLVLMRALVDELAFESDPDGRHRVTLEKRLKGRPALRLIAPE